MEREELIRSKEFWITNIQIELFELIENYLKDNNLNKTQLAARLGVTKGYVTQVLNGDFDHKISKLVELSMACGAVPVINFVSLDEYVAKENNTPVGQKLPLKAGNLNGIPDQTKRKTKAA